VPGGYKKYNVLTKISLVIGILKKSTARGWNLEWLLHIWCDNRPHNNKISYNL